MSNQNLSSCPKCSQELKPAASFCNACGHNLKSTRKSKLDLYLLGSVVAVVAAIFLAFNMQSAQSEPEFDHPDVSSFMNKMDPSKMPEMPNDYAGLVTFGNNMMDMGMYPQAIQAYLKAIEKKSDDPNVLVDLGTCYYGSGSYDDAIKYFKQALTIEPTHKIAHLNLGIVYNAASQPEMTRKYWNKLIEIAPEDPIADTVKKYLEHLN